MQKLPFRNTPEDNLWQDGSLLNVAPAKLSIQISFSTIYLFFGSGYGNSQSNHSEVAVISRKLQRQRRVFNSTVPTMHHFFGSRHGKGPRDGELAANERPASQGVVIGRDIISYSKCFSIKQINFWRKEFFWLAIKIN